LEKKKAMRRYDRTLAKNDPFQHQSQHRFFSAYLYTTRFDGEDFVWLF